MGDRENLSIPVNLAFLAGLLVVSHLLTVVAPVRTVDAKLPDPPSADMVLPAPKPASDKPGPDDDIGGRHDAETADRRDAGGDGAKAGIDLARPTADTPGPAPDITPAPVSQARLEHAAPKPIKPMSPVERPEAPEPALVPIRQAAGIMPQGNAGSGTPQILSLNR